MSSALAFAKSSRAAVQAKPQKSVPRTIKSAVDRKTTTPSSTSAAIRPTSSSAATRPSTTTRTAPSTSRPATATASKPPSRLGALLGAISTNNPRDLSAAYTAYTAPAPSNKRKRTEDDVPTAGVVTTHAAADDTARASVKRHCQRIEDIPPDTSYRYGPNKGFLDTEKAHKRRAKSQRRPAGMPRQRFAIVLKPADKPVLPDYYSAGKVGAAFIPSAATTTTGPEDPAGPAAATKKRVSRATKVKIAPRVPPPSTSSQELHDRFLARGTAARTGGQMARDVPVEKDLKWQSNRRINHQKGLLDGRLALMGPSPEDARERKRLANRRMVNDDRIREEDPNVGYERFLSDVEE